MNLRPTGTPPEAIQPLQTLQIDRDVPMPRSNPRNVVRNTLVAMRPGDSFKAEGSSLSNIYKWGTLLRIRLRAKRLSGEARMPGSSYRVWRAE